MKIVSRVALAIGFLLSAGSAVAQDAPKASIPGIGPTGPIEQLKGTFKFTEGPASDGKGHVFFTDIPSNRIHQIDSTGAISVFLEPSGHANGLMCDGRGNLLACQMDGALVAIDLKTKKVKVLADRHQGKRFNAPNDLVIDRTGGVYFTDPHFRAPMPLPQGTTGVYYYDPSGKVSRLIDDLEAPNGILLSPDEKTFTSSPVSARK